MRKNKITKYKIPIEVKTQKSSTYIQKTILWSLFLLLITFMLAGIFFLLLKITKHFFMESISWNTVPWIYLSLYVLSIASVFTIVFFAKKFINAVKRKQSP